MINTCTPQVEVCHPASQLSHQFPLASCTVTQNGHVLLEMCLVHCDTEWTRVVRDVFCALTHNGHVLLEMCLWNSTVVCRKYSFQQICRAIFWSLTQPNGCGFLAAKEVLSGVECGNELYCFLSQGLPLSLCIAPTPHAVSGARPTLVVGSGFFIFRMQSPQG